MPHAICDNVNAPRANSKCNPARPMDWFERLTGFAETTYEETRARLAVEGGCLVSRVNGSRHRVGDLELPTLGELRARAGTLPAPGRPSRVGTVIANVRDLHRVPEFAGALFQVASQFNLLEMPRSDVTPEHGVAAYESDPTQGPACAVAAGAATIYRNYFAPVGDACGQTSACQIDALADVGTELSRRLSMPVDALWTMRNGYALCTPDGLLAIERHLASADEAARDDLRSRLRIGTHWNVEVTDAPAVPRPIVSQAFCSALPIGYSDIPAPKWRRFASLVLEGAYEATLLAAALHPRRGGTHTVLLTRLGGGVFRNEAEWIDAAIGRAIARAKNWGLDIRIVRKA